MISTIESFLKRESSAGIVLIFATIFALLLQNSGFSEVYGKFLNTHVEIRFGNLQIAKPLLLWVNDGLMAVFFFLVGLEVKREIIEGHLSSLSQIALPGLAAIGGMLIPALIFFAFNHGQSFAANGWAIPTTTDIAFSLGALTLLGKRCPFSLKIFLLALAIFDDLGAIVIIALFYTSSLSMTSIILASITLIALFTMNRLHIAIKAAYILLGIVLWVSVLKSGVHATLAGVALAFTIPFNCRSREGEHFSMSKEMEYALHYWVAFMILPLFAFVNAGIDLREVSINQILSPVPMGIMLGLFLGKQLGVFAFSWIAIKAGLAKMPQGSTWIQLYGVSILTGIGFTMSFFIDSLAYNDTKLFYYTDKLAILIGSLLSGVIGCCVLLYSRSKKNPSSE